MPALPFTKPIAEITATAPNTATKAKPYVCTTCTRPFARLEHLKRHERSHTKEKPFCCEMAGDLPGCGRRFARRDLLLRHQQKIHLCPNTSKRRRLSNSTASTNTLASRKSTSPVTDLRTQYTVTMPNLDDMKNYSHGTINPSSIFSSSPPRSARSSGDSPTFSDSQLPQQLSPDFSWATERLLPVEEQQLYEQMWPVPELALASSPSTMSSASWSPQYHDQSYSSLGQPNQLEMAGSDSDLFSPDFFIGNGTYQQGASSSNLMMQQIQAQFMASQQFEQYATKPLLPMTDAAYITDASLRMQFAPDMAYCTSFRPEQQAMYGNFVETY